MEFNLEDLFSNIIELRRKGLDSQAIGKEIDHDPEIVEYCEGMFKDILLESFAQGKNISQIAEETKLSPTLVLQSFGLYASQELIRDIFEKNAPSFTEMGERVKNLYDDGKSRKEIASELGISRGSVRIYGSSAGINWSKKRVNLKKSVKKNLEETASEINDSVLLEKNSRELDEFISSIFSENNSLKDIAEKTNNVSTTNEPAENSEVYSSENKIKISKKERSDLDSMIEQGLSLKEIGEVYGVSAERARQIIKEQGKTEIFRTIRHMQTKIFKENGKNKELSEILGCLTQRTDELVKKEGWAYQKALEYLDKPRQNAGSRLVSNSFDDLLVIFEKYENAQKNGQKLSLIDLSEGTNFIFPQVGKILNDVGVSPMYGDKWKGRTPTPRDKKEAVKRALAVQIPATDIAYFLGVPNYVIENNITAQGLRKNRLNIAHAIKQFGSGKNHRALNYRLASEIYEASDKCKFNIQETAEILDVSQKLVNYALEHRNEIEPVILDSLRVLYNDSKINEPYKKIDF